MKNSGFKYLDTPHPKQDAVEFYRAFYDFDVRKHISDIESLSSEELNHIALNKALDLFHAAAKRVPAYRTYLKENNINPHKIKTHTDFISIPPIDKNNYLSKYSYKDLHWDGQPNNTTMLSVSSGSSGAPYFWPRSIYLEYETAITYELLLSQFFEIDKNETLVIIAYSMGMYVAGTFTLNSLRRIASKGYRVVTLSPGIDSEEVYTVMKKLLPDYRNIVIAGYPPLVKDIIDYSLEKRISFSNKHIKFIFGAENFSENWRTQIMKLVGISTEDDIIHSSFNTYGSADAAILGYETPLSINIRRKINALGETNKYFNTQILPSFVQYNPLMKYFEEVENNLIFTCEAGVPLIRYDIHDRGAIYDYHQFKSLNIKDNSFWRKLPFLKLEGKDTNTVTLYGLKIFPENVKYTIEDEQLLLLLSGKFKLQTCFDNDQNQHIKILLETKTRKTLTARDMNLICHKILLGLLKYNLEFAALYGKLGHKVDPKIMFVPRGEFKQITSKHKWVS